MDDLALWRESTIEQQTGWKRTTRWEKRRDGLLPMPITVDGLAMTPAREIRTINAARIRGATDEDIRSLVKELAEARKLVTA